jgi:hypothetical protein
MTASGKARHVEPVPPTSGVHPTADKPLHRSPDTASFEDVRRYQLHLAARGADAPTLNHRYPYPPRWDGAGSLGVGDTLLSKIQFLQRLKADDRSAQRARPS